jgi:aryl-alcohol dehydrogenase-like predicted oxidoreductase
MNLPTTPLGATSFTITGVGFGAWAIGGGDWAFGWGAQDDTESIAAIRYAIDQGVNWIDTAAVYGLGHSERIVARAVADIPPSERPAIFTKCGLVWDPAAPMEPARRVGAPESIRTELDASLKRLGVDQIDLYQLHWPPEDGTPIADAVGALNDLKKDGKVRAIGVSNFSVAQLEQATQGGGVDTLQPPFSPISREIASDVLPYCADHDIGVIVYSPMHSGLLSGSWSAQRTASLDENDWRRRSPDFSGDRLTRNLALVGVLRDVADRHGTTVAAVAIAWTRAFPGVTAAIVGARRPSQIDGWIGAATLRLTDSDLDEIAAGIEATGAGQGPRRPS